VLEQKNDSFCSSTKKKQCFEYRYAAICRNDEQLWHIATRHNYKYQEVMNKLPYSNIVTHIEPIEAPTSLTDMVLDRRS